MRPMIEIAHLSKRFGSIEAVRDLSFTVREGELFAFLGINGAGKAQQFRFYAAVFGRTQGKCASTGKAWNRTRRR